MGINIYSHIHTGAEELLNVEIMRGIHFFSYWLDLQLVGWSLSFLLIDKKLIFIPFVEWNVRIDNHRHRLRRWHSNSGKCTHWSRNPAAVIGLHVNAHKTEYICLNQRGDISTHNGRSLKLVDNFIKQGRNVSSTETDINTRIEKHGQLTIGYRSYGSQTWPMK